MKVYIERKEKSDREGDRETETILQARGQNSEKKEETTSRQNL